MRTVCVIAVSVLCFGATNDPFTPAQRKYWAFQPVTHPQAPSVQHKNWIANPIDAFITQKLEEKNLSLAPQADRATLLRRVTFDLIGLPPTPAEIDAFVADQSPKAYEKVVDRLLAYPQYGERWARHRLDLARFAESSSFKSDETRLGECMALSRLRDSIFQRK